MTSGAHGAHRRVVDAEPLGDAGAQVVLDDVGAAPAARATSGGDVGCLRSAAMARLPRLAPSKISASGRIGSPAMASTLITSAPRSDSSRCPYGAAKNVANSTTSHAVERTRASGVPAR